MTTETKALIGVGIGTLLLIGGLGWFSSYSGKQTEEVVDSARLVNEHSYAMAAPDGKVTLVEFGDFQCPSCAAMHPAVQKLMEEYKDKVTFVWRNFPLPQHEYAVIAAQVALSAGDQGKFWEMHGKLFGTQNKWSAASSEQEALNIFSQYAQDLGLDSQKLVSDIESKRFLDAVMRDRSDGNSLSVNSTPTFFLNGKKLTGMFSYAQLKQVVDKELQ